LRGNNKTGLTGLYQTTVPIHQADPYQRHFAVLGEIYPVDGNIIKQERQHVLTGSSVGADLFGKRNLPGIGQRLGRFELPFRCLGLQEGSGSG